MRYEYIEPIVNSTKAVLRNVLGTEVESGETALVDGEAISGDIMIIVQVSGDSEGSLILTMEAPTAARVCSAMSGAECGPLNDESLDMMAELANMITGNATSALCDLGHDFTLFPPLVFAADRLRERAPGVEMFRIPVRSVLGEIQVNVAMKTN